jgi:hypothetical protein
MGRAAAEKLITIVGEMKHSIAADWQVKPETEANREGGT